MDSTIAGALIGAGLTAIAAWIGGIIGGKRDSKLRQLDAVAEFLSIMDHAILNWKEVAGPYLKALQDGRSSLNTLKIEDESAKQLVDAHREVVTELRLGLTVLDLRLRQRQVRACLPAIEEAVKKYAFQVESAESMPAILQDRDESVDWITPADLDFIKSLQPGKSLEAPRAALVESARKHLTN